MTPDDLIRLLDAHWAAVLDALDPADRTELAALLRGLTAAEDPPAVQGALRRLRRLLRALPDAHPVAAALRSGVRFAGAPGAVLDRAPVLALLARLPEPAAAPGTGAAQPGAAAPPLDPVRARLLAAPSLGAAELGAGGAEPGLIRLRDPQRGDRYPLFQFAAGGTRPLPVVSRINRLLMADRDPWGAADWWLGGNRWLRGVPAELLGSVPDDELTRAVLELVEGE
ncbi:hypothetical protein [Streptomyces sp. NPDC089919]|uniref:hypothetical protein n=1 Tax=Streptomyces sp. NPDC089919 TaxID=3155188 RepID=UPI0034311AEE